MLIRPALSHFVCAAEQATLITQMTRAAGVTRGVSDRGMADAAGLLLRARGRVIVPGPGDRVLLACYNDDLPPVAVMTFLPTQLP